VDVTCYEVKGESHLSELESPTGGPWGDMRANLIKKGLKILKG
jgi:hypothetical protein